MAAQSSYANKDLLITVRIVEKKCFNALLDLNLLCSPGTLPDG
jgi:hypothetical protein